MTQSLSLNGAQFIAGFEGFFSTPYNDPGGNATIGFGYLIHLGPVTQADREAWGVITREQAWTQLVENMEIKGYAPAVRRAVRVPLSQNMFDALVSWVMNHGTGVASDASGVIRRLNNREYFAVREELAKWNKGWDARLGRSVFMSGLARRREEEGDLFEDGAHAFLASLLSGVSDPGLLVMPMVGD